MNSLHPHIHHHVTRPEHSFPLPNSADYIQHDYRHRPDFPSRASPDAVAGSPTLTVRSCDNLSPPSNRPLAEFPNAYVLFQTAEIEKEDKLSSIAPRLSQEKAYCTKVKFTTASPSFDQVRHN